MAGAAMMLAACNDYLDVVPDNRTEIDNVDKVGMLLGGSYPYYNYAEMLNPRVDNVTDKGEGTSSGIDTNRDSFFWRDVQNQTTQCTPTQFWVGSWASIAGANGALDAVAELEKDPTADQQLLSYYKGEGLTLRAYNHFLMACIFCKFYDLDNAGNNSTNAGLPYVKEQETEIHRQFDRGTVEQLWDNIRTDLEEGLSLIGPDNTYSVPKYHFNQYAANTFASRYYLYHGDFAKVVETASKVVPQPTVIPGANVPANDVAAVFVTNNFHPWTTTYNTMTSSTDIKLGYNSTSAPSNLLLADGASYIGMYTNSWRYATSSPDCNRTVSAANPTGAAFAYKIFHSGDYNYYVPKFYYYFKRTTINASTGVYHTEYIYFRMEEALINRAEAYARMDKYDEAIADLNLFCRTRIVNYNETTHALTLAKIASFYAATVRDGNFYMNKYNAFGSQGWSDEKKALVHFILFCRQAEYLHESLRYWDMVRYKIECTHETHPSVGSRSNTLYPGDDRWVLQIPETVTLAGIEQNPRTNLLSPEW
jgi:hypothetical protein